MLVSERSGNHLADGIVEAWTAANSHAVARSQELLSAFRATGVVDLAMLTVANHEIAAMVGG